MFSKTMAINGYDTELWESIVNETRRQEDHIELIASENLRQSAGAGGAGIGAHQ